MILACEITLNCDIGAVAVGVVTMIINIIIAVKNYKLNRALKETRDKSERFNLLKRFVLYFGPAYKMTSSLLTECKNFSEDNISLERVIAGKVAHGYTNAASQTVGFDAGGYLLLFDRNTVDTIQKLKELYEEISARGTGEKINVYELKSQLNKTVLLWDEMVSSFSKFMNVNKNDMRDLVWQWVVM